MAERRMFAKTIIDSDAFLDMPLSSQALYFHLSMRADDDGFINNPKKIQRMIGATEDDLRLLILKSFVLTFDSGVLVIKHWKMHNYIQSDRYKPTVYQEEKAMLTVKKNRAYSLSDTECIQDVYSTDTQVRLGKDRLGKDRLINISSAEDKKDIEKEAEENFQKLWELYPRKKGKGGVSKSKKKELLKIGYDKMAKCVELFKQDMAGREEQYIPYGSTFFNTEYKDYLERVEKKPEKPKEPEVEKIDLEWQRQFYENEEEWQQQLEKWRKEGRV